MPFTSVSLPLSIHRGSKCQSQPQTAAPTASRHGNGGHRCISEDLVDREINKLFHHATGWLSYSPMMGCIHTATGWYMPLLVYVPFYRGTLQLAVELKKLHQSPVHKASRLKVAQTHDKSQRWKVSSQWIPGEINPNY